MLYPGLRVCVLYIYVCSVSVELTGKCHGAAGHFFSLQTPPGHPEHAGREFYFKVVVVVVGAVCGCLWMYLCLCVHVYLYVHVCVFVFVFVSLPYHGGRELVYGVS